MNNRSIIARLTLAFLLAISSSVQAWAMQADLFSSAEVAMEVGMGMEKTSDHCQDQSDATNESTCKHEHCSMCSIGLAVYVGAIGAPVPHQMLPAEDFFSIDIQIDKLYRPPRSLV